MNAQRGIRNVRRMREIRQASNDKINNARPLSFSRQFSDDNRREIQVFSRFHYRRNSYILQCVFQHFVAIFDTTIDATIFQLFRVLDYFRVAFDVEN